MKPNHVSNSGSVRCPSVNCIFIKALFVLAPIIFYSATAFAQNHHPDSVHRKGRNVEYFDNTFEPSDNALGGNIFVGYGMYSGNLETWFTDPWYLGINIDIHRRSLVIQVDDYLGFGLTKKTMKFSDNTEWKNDKAVFSYLFGCNLGLKMIDSRTIMLVPLAGINATSMSSSFIFTTQNTIDSPFIPGYKIGFYVDFKSLNLLQEHVRVNDSDVNYTSLRLSFGINQPIGTTRNSAFYHGSMFYVTIGMGGLSR